MAVNYAEKYSQIVDERFKIGALTSALVNYAYDWVGVSTVKVFSVPTATMGDYKLDGANRYGTPAELENEVQEMVLSKDRAFTFTIDKKSEDDTMGTMAAAAALRRQIDEVIIPEIDTYRIAKLVAGADVSHVVKDVAVTKANAYEKFLAVQEILDNAKVPTGGIGDYFENLAITKTTTAPVPLFIKAILCNILVCLAVWCGIKMKSESGKLIMIFWCIFVFMVCGFEHSIANMSSIGVSLITGKVGIGAYFYNVIIVTLGNMVGGVLGVALPYHLISKEK